MTMKGVRKKCIYDYWLWHDIVEILWLNLNEGTDQNLICMLSFNFLSLNDALQGRDLLILEEKWKSQDCMDNNVNCYISQWLQCIICLVKAQVLESHVEKMFYFREWAGQESLEMHENGGNPGKRRMWLNSGDWSFWIKYQS